MALPDHYRYHDVLNEDGLHLVCDTYQAIKETECGYYVVLSHGNHRRPPEAVEHLLKDKRANRVRFVLKVSCRRHCYPDKAEALWSYGKRKEMQIQHAAHALARAKHALAAVKNISELGNGYPVCKHTGAIEVGMPEEFKGYSWDF